MWMISMTGGRWQDSERSALQQAGGLHHSRVPPRFARQGYASWSLSKHPGAKKKLAEDGRP